MNQKILTAMLIAVCLCLAAGAAFAQEAGEIAGATEAVSLPDAQDSWFSWHYVIEGVLVPALIYVLRGLLKANKSNKWVELTLKVVAGVVEQLEPSGTAQAEQTIKPMIESAMRKTGQYQLLDAEVNKAKGAT